jgi:uncharacterized protein YaiI (UPF0178 family)
MIIAIDLIITVVNIVLIYKICRLSYTRDTIKELFNLDKKEINNNSLDVCVLKDVERRLKEDKEYTGSLRKKEMESRVHNQVIEDIDNTHKDIIDNRTAKLLETQQLVANIDFNLEKLAMHPYIKTYAKNGFYYTLAYIHGHYAAHYLKTCLRFRKSSKDDIQGMSDICKDAAKLAELTPFIEGKLIDIVEFHDFLPDFYESCLKELKGNGEA